MKVKDLFWLVIIFGAGSLLKSLVPSWSKGLPIDWDSVIFESASIIALLVVMLIIIFLFNRKS